MSDTTGRFSQWWRGSSTGDESAFASLSSRTSTGMTSLIAADNHLGELLLNTSLAQKRIWTLPGHMQAVALGWWLTLMHWQWATRYYLDTTRGDYGDTLKMPPRAIEQCTVLCDLAEKWTVEAIGNEKRAEVGVQIPLVGMQSFPQLVVDEQTHVGLWAFCDATALQVQTDLNRILSAQVPRRLQPVVQQLQQVVSPNVALLEHYQQSWLTTTTVAAKIDIVQHALGPAKELFEAGQQLWAPYLLGSTYTACISRRPALEDLELGFDPWVVTDPEVRDRYQRDPKAVEELVALWMANPDPGQTYRLQQEILGARSRRAIRYMDGKTLPYCPWTPVWVAWKPVTIGGIHLEAGTMFALYIGPGGDGTFVSEARRAGKFRLEVTAIR